VKHARSIPRRGHALRRCVLALTPWCLALHVGCASQGIRPGDGPVHRPVPAAQRAPIDRAAIAAAYNARVGELTSLKTPATLVIDRPDAPATKGRSRDQVEASLQFVAPAKVSLHLTKVAQSLAHIGSDDRAYWSIQLGDDKRAYVGVHDRATIAKARSLGLPVHPLDLIELLCVTPLPPDAAMRWSDDGSAVLVSTPGRWGRRVLWLDPTTYEPFRVALGDTRDVVAVSARLSRWKPVFVDGNARAAARVPGFVAVSIPGPTKQDEARIDISIIDPRVEPRRIKPGAFDLRALLDAYRVREVIDVDTDREQP
jgi:hypothetical protein